MKKCIFIKLFLVLLTFAPLIPIAAQQQSKFPYAEAGLSKEAAAIHLLSRFTYGYKLEDVAYIQQVGLENWFKEQLSMKVEDKEVHKHLQPYADAMLDNRSLLARYPRTQSVKQMMIRDGYIKKDSINNTTTYRIKLNEYLEDKGLKSPQYLYNMFIASKFIRASYSKNQLAEVMTDFWFNHFNVSFTKGQSAPYIPSYENHSIRPYILGKFSDLLLATAKSPAMLTYLDNVASTAENTNSKRKSGLNENYARELLELHTLGVDGGYTQRDVREAARILTGWTINSRRLDGNPDALNRLAKNRSNVIEDDFLFLSARHDKGEKAVMGKIFSNKGYTEGLELLEFLAARPETAKFIARKLAIRFVSDTPSEALITEMASTFLSSKGDIKQVLVTMVNSPSFWEKNNIGSKIKTPFELAISSVRALDGNLENPEKLNKWVTRMGEKKYYYIAPTGFPDRASQWINSGSLLNRMNFGLSFLKTNVTGVRVDLVHALHDREPESAAHALDVFGKNMVPNMDQELLKRRLSPLLTTQNLQQKVSRSIPSSADDQRMSIEEAEKNTTHPMLEQVVGLIIGSPEFQRR
ncbi:DUF1800 domain-containing protein [Sphingobacterium alkalisoli]|uniref:DUF1800 domain-containing protein n=1 Tax=Sphingobacterium alkalisoli TaxID=1874115 RepID=A0A4U0GXV6_9SPHI|nr:DUF1800 domain-containing protein [Sphingobacterium alkalisoli]TJY63973.1 DUF1800 domain-containing protein [Sphingobacterium alkalisoli]GGH23709.1 hypothetical protein GCM10011418_31100 [Sphingobacterium alkalisoli]